jgi:hypothetical protein
MREARFINSSPQKIIAKRDELALSRRAVAYLETNRAALPGGEKIVWNGASWVYIPV